MSEIVSIQITFNKEQARIMLKMQNEKEDIGMENLQEKIIQTGNMD